MKGVNQMDPKQYTKQNWEQQNTPKEGGPVKILIVLLIILAVVGAGVTIWNTTQSDDTATPAINDVDNTELVVPIPDEQAQATITSDGFQPSSLRVIAGSKVTWTNESNEDVDLRSENAEFFDTENALSTGDSYTFTFDRQGEYTITSPQNAEWTMMVIVE
jgi:plastocyanin